jgi:hypothetical protein
MSKGQTAADVAAPVFPTTEIGAEEIAAYLSMKMEGANRAQR